MNTYEQMNIYIMDQQVEAISGPSLFLSLSFPLSSE